MCGRTGWYGWYELGNVFDSRRVNHVQPAAVWYQALSLANDSGGITSHNAHMCCHPPASARAAPRPQERSVVTQVHNTVSQFAKQGIPVHLWLTALPQVRRAAAWGFWTRVLHTLACAAGCRSALLVPPADRTAVPAAQWHFV